MVKKLINIHHEEEQEQDRDKDKREREREREQEEPVQQGPVQVGEAGPLGLDNHPLGPGRLGPGLINLKWGSAFVRKAWKGRISKSAFQNTDQHILALVIHS